MGRLARRAEHGSYETVVPGLTGGLCVNAARAMCRNFRVDAYFYDVVGATSLGPLAPTHPATQGRHSYGRGSYHRRRGRVRAPAERCLAEKVCRVGTGWFLLHVLVVCVCAGVRADVYGVSVCACVCVDVYVCVCASVCVHVCVCVNAHLAAPLRPFFAHFARAFFLHCVLSKDCMPPQGHVFFLRAAAAAACLPCLALPAIVRLLCDQMRWRKKGAFDFNRPKLHPVNKAATKQRNKAQVRAHVKCV